MAYSEGLRLVEETRARMLSILSETAHLRARCALSPLLGGIFVTSSFAICIQDLLQSGRFDENLRRETSVVA